MADLFISYRRDDSLDMSERIHDQLVQRFGARKIFRDVDAIPIGSDFQQTLQFALQDCRAMVVLIGPRWLQVVNASGQPRLFEPSDFVRYEIAYGLQHGKLVIPVLLNGARMPTAGELPSEIAGLASIPPLVVRPNPNFAPDLEGLFQAVQGTVKRGPNNPVTLTLAAVSAACIPVAFAVAAASSTSTATTAPLAASQVLGALAVIAMFGMLTIMPVILSVFTTVRAARTRRWGWFMAFTIPLALDVLGGILGFSAPGVFALFVPTLLATIVALVIFGFIGPAQPPKYVRSS